MFLKRLLQFLTVQFIIECTFGHLQTDFFYPHDYKYFQATQSFYKIHDTAMNLTEAQMACTNENADLLIVEDQNEADLIVSYIKETQPSLLGIFVGISDEESDGNFTTTDGRSISDVYNKWINGQPNITNAREDCVKMFPNGIFDIIYCNQTLRFICKKPLQSFRRPGQVSTPFILNGVKTSINRVPYQVYLRLRRNTLWYDCGGSIISNQYILTAAHCLSGVSKIVIRAGSAKFDRGGQTYSTTTFFGHPQFDPHTHDYDVGVIRVQRGMTLDNINTRIIELPSNKSEVPPNEDLFIAGWGALSEHGPYSTDLMSVYLKTNTDEVCRQTYSNKTSRMFCAGFPEGGKDACRGDSGGPAVLSSSGIQVGIISFGYGCGQPNTPGVYTNVSAVRDWIRLTTEI